MEPNPFDEIAQRLEALSSLPIEGRVEELGQIHDQLKNFLDSPSS
jgi:hypothetical protein